MTYTYEGYVCAVYDAPVVRGAVPAETAVPSPPRVSAPTGVAVTPARDNAGLGICASTAIGVSAPTVALLERRRPCRPCLHRFNRFLWIVLSRWWLLWSKGLVFVHPEAVVRWRRNGWSAIWGYRLRNHWWGGGPRVSDEAGGCARMACENFLWGVRRSHGEPLMLGVILPQWGWKSLMESVSRMA